MEVVLFVICCIIFSTGGAYSYKTGSSRGLNHKTSPALMCTIYMLIVTVGYIIAAFITKGRFDFSWPIFWFALLTGVSFSIAAYFYLISYAIGPFTPTVIIMGMSAFMPILYSYIFLKESITPMQLIAFVLMVGVVFVLSTAKSGNASGQKGVNKKWLFFMLIVFLFNGLIGFGIRLQARLAPADQMLEFFALTFFLGFLLSALIFTFTGGWKAKESPRKLMLPCLGLSFFIGINVIFMQLLSSRLPAVVQYPLVSGVSIILSTLIGKFIFKDKLPLRAYIAIVVGIIAIVMLSL